MIVIKFCSVASVIQYPKFQLKHVQGYALLFAYSIWLRPLALEFNLKWNSVPIQFTAKHTKNISWCREKRLLTGICIKGHNLVCNELAMLKIPDDIS